MATLKRFLQSEDGDMIERLGGIILSIAIAAGIGGLIYTAVNALGERAAEDITNLTFPFEETP